MGIGKIDPEYAVREGWVRDEDDEIYLDGYNAFIQITTHDGTSGFQIKNDIGAVFFSADSDGDGYVAKDLSVERKIITNQLMVLSGATTGYVLTSDAQGNALWQETAASINLDGYALQSDLDTLQDQTTDIQNALDGYLSDINLDGYALQSDLIVLQGQVTNIQDSLDGYVLQPDFDILDQQVTNIQNGLDGYISGIEILHDSGLIDSETTSIDFISPLIVSGVSSNSVKVEFDTSILDGYSSDNGFTIFPIWAEETAGLNNSSQEWSFGNGATGDIGIPLPIQADLFAISVEADVAGTNTEIAVQKNRTSDVSSITFTGRDATKTIVTPVSFLAGDVVGFKTVTAGGASNVRIAAWFRIPSTPVSTLLIGDMLDVDITGINVGDFLYWNGTTFLPISLDLDGYALQVDLEALQDQTTDIQIALDGYTVGSDLDGYAIQSDVDTLSSQVTDIQIVLDGYVTGEDLDGYALQSELVILQGQVTDIQGSLDGYVLQSDFDDLDGQVTGIQNVLDGYALQSDLEDLQEQTTNIQNALDGYLTDINLDGYALQTDLETLQNQVTGIQAELDGYCTLEKCEEISDQVTNIQIALDGYVLQTDFDILDQQVTDIQNVLDGYIDGIAIQDSGTPIVSSAATINFGTNLSVTDDGNGQVTVDASGGSNIPPGILDGYITEDDHRTLDQLVHNISEDSYDEYFYTGLGRISKIITWTDSGKTQKIREAIITYNGIMVNSVTTIQYNEAGTEVERETESYSYNGFVIDNVTRTLV